jgi:hypothetical protein
MNVNNKNLKLSDIDISKLNIDVNNNMVTYLDGITNNSYYINNLPSEIQKYCINKIKLIHLVNNDIKRPNNLKLSDFDLEKIKFDKENKKVIIYDEHINICDILSDEIRNYCYDKIYDISNEKDVCKYFIESTKVNHGRLSVNVELYNKIKSLNHKIHINKYIFMTYQNQLISSHIIKQLLSIYIYHSSLLIDLIKDIIMTKNKELLRQILINKPILIKNIDYDKLKEFAINSNIYEIYDILIIYESLDYLSNDIYFEKAKIN